MLTAPRARLAVGPSRPSASDKELDLIPATLRWHGPLHPPPIVGEGYVEHERYREVGLAVATRNVDDACQNRLVVVPRSTKRSGDGEGLPRDQLEICDRPLGL